MIFNIYSHNKSMHWLYLSVDQKKKKKIQKFDLTLFLWRIIGCFMNTYICFTVGTVTLLCAKFSFECKTDNENYLDLEEGKLKNSRSTKKKKLLIKNGFS